MLTGLMIFGALVAGFVALVLRYAVDSTDGQDWMERRVQ